MAIQDVVQDPKKILHTKTDAVRDFSDPTFGGLIDDMRDTLVEQDGLGLAAPQINVSKRIFVIPPEYAPLVRTPWRPLSYFRPFRPVVFVNPTITSYSSVQETVDEGCLSIRNYFAPTPRAYRVTLKAQNERGVRFKVKAEGLLARIFQHETDHLNGILFIERAARP